MDGLENRPARPQPETNILDSGIAFIVPETNISVYQQYGIIYVREPMDFDDSHTTPRPVMCGENHDTPMEETRIALANLEGGQTLYMFALPPKPKGFVRRYGYIGNS